MSLKEQEERAEHLLCLGVPKHEIAMATCISKDRIEVLELRLIVMRLLEGQKVCLRAAWWNEFLICVLGLIILAALVIVLLSPKILMEIIR